MNEALPRAKLWHLSLKVKVKVYRSPPIASESPWPEPRSSRGRVREPALSSLRNLCMVAAAHAQAGTPLSEPTSSLHDDGLPFDRGK